MPDLSEHAVACPSRGLSDDLCRAEQATDVPERTRPGVWSILFSSTKSQNTNARFEDSR